MSSQDMEQPIEETNEEKEEAKFKKKKETLNLNLIAEYLTKLAEPLKQFIRAIRGEAPLDDAYNGLIHVNDDRERAMLTPNQANANAYMELLADYGKEKNHGSDIGNPFAIFKAIAIMDNKYSIGGSNGVQWDKAILMVHARQPTVTPISLTTPTIQAPQQQTKKTHWYSRESKQTQPTTA